MGPLREVRELPSVCSEKLDVPLT